MHRRKPFSGKEKKKQLQEKRNRKKDGPVYLRKLSDENSLEESNQGPLPSAAGAENTTSLGGCSNAKANTPQEIQRINEQPGSQRRERDADSFRLHFFKESEESIKRKRKEAMRPIRHVSQDCLKSRLEEVYPENAKLDFPKRPLWNFYMSKEQLENQEQQYFQDYVFNVTNQARSQDLSYMELNLETWRQLWRVLEISDILLLVADIRYPTLHLPPSLVNHIVKDLGKPVIVVLNKVDFVPPTLALAWKKYLQAKFPAVRHFVFFSSYPREQSSQDFEPSKDLYKRPFQGRVAPLGPAELLTACRDIVKENVDLNSWESKIMEDHSLHAHESGTNCLDEENSCADSETSSGSIEKQLPDPKQSDVSPRGTRPSDIEREGEKMGVFQTVEEPEAGKEMRGFEPQITYAPYKDGIVTIGFVGYPNSGKSSLLNAVVGRKVVSVSKSPGHTKHFQTIFLTKTVKLCDCPGLVFPSMVPKSLQVIAGIFPVAQVREPLSVVGFLAKRLDLPRLLKLQPQKSPSKKKEKNGDEHTWSAYDICEAFAIRHGFVTSKAGRPDVVRGANNILRLAVEGQLCLHFFPPNEDSHSETDELLEVFHKVDLREGNDENDAESAGNDAEDFEEDAGNTWDDVTHIVNDVKNDVNDVTNALNDVTNDENDVTNVVNDVTNVGVDVANEER